VSQGREIPHDDDAEDSALGAMLLDSEARDHVRALIDASDFYIAGNGLIFDTICDLDDAGEHVDATTVAARLRTKGLLERVGGSGAVARIMASTPSTSGAATYAEIVGRHAHTRRVMAVLAESLDSTYGTLDPAALVENVSARLASVAGVPTELPTDADSIDEWLLQPHHEPPWVIPGMMRQNWRVVIVAAEGAGKSVATRQIALCAAQGVHPFDHSDVPPVNTLLIDLENPGEAIKDTGDRIIKLLRARRGSDYRDNACWIWHRPSGLDLRNRRDRAEMEVLLEHVRPQVVCLGPLYRAFTRRSREDHEEAAEQVQRALDKLRTRYGFGLILEHHAPKGLAGRRDLVPFGSSLWQRWPDMGLTLERDDDLPGSLVVGQYRGHRVRARWPDRLDRGVGWPWSGYWPGGMHGTGLDF